VGLVSANTEGWALYAGRLMDELGFYSDAEWRMGYLDGQMMRATASSWTSTCTCS
jgi:uncharacterized protein (DUF885 family)